MIRALWAAFCKTRAEYHMSRIRDISSVAPGWVSYNCCPATAEALARHTKARDKWIARHEAAR